MSSSSSFSNNNNNNNNQYEGFYFRVHGKVQGVYFRKYTQQTAISLGVAGWIRNDKTNGTVEGQVVCLSNDNNSKCDQMKVLLQSEGSPMSQIDHADFQTMTDPQELQALWRDLQDKHESQPAFEIRKTYKGRR